MNIVRLKKGKNDFALANLTLGQIHNIRRALDNLAQTGDVLAEESRDWIDHFHKNNPNISPWGEDCVEKIRPKT